MPHDIIDFNTKLCCFLFLRPSFMRLLKHSSNYNMENLLHLLLINELSYIKYYDLKLL